MPKKPPFNHFRKSCRSPSSGNKKEKRNYQCHLFPARDVPACPTAGCVGEGERGEQEGCSWWPCQPYIALACLGPASPTRPFPEDRHLQVSLEQLPASRGIPPTSSHTCRDNRSCCPHTQRNPLAGHTRSLILHPASQRAPFLPSVCSLQCLWAVQQLSLTRAA